MSRPLKVAIVLALLLAGWHTFRERAPKCVRWQTELDVPEPGHKWKEIERCVRYAP